MSSPREPNERRPIRDVDSAAVATRIRAFTWSLIAAAPAALIGGRVGAGTSAPLLVTGAFALGGFAIAFFGSLALGERLGRTAGSIYFASGRSTPGEREYSLAESLIVRGRFDEAGAELERAAAQYPDDPAPALRLARLLRDHCGRPEEAVRWFRQAVARSGRDAGAEIGALRELIELYTHVLKTPRRAMPELARLAERYADTPAGTWAKRELVEIRESMRSSGES